MAKDDAATPLIEREREMRALERVLEHGRTGAPSALLVVGEPGLGKSRLLRMVAGEGGTLVLRGYSLEADTPPYFPFRRALAAADRAGILPATSLAMPTLRAAGVLSGERPAAGEFPAIDSLAV